MAWWNALRRAVVSTEDSEDFDELAYARRVLTGLAEASWDTLDSHNLAVARKDLRHWHKREKLRLIAERLPDAFSGVHELSREERDMVRHLLENAK